MDSVSQNLTHHKKYVALWTASTVSYFGSNITTLALQVLVLVRLGGNAVDVGWVSSARWLPYAALGLLAGTMVDRVNRKHVVVAADIGRGLLLSVLCVMAATHLLTFPVLLGLILGFGTLSLAHDVANQATLAQFVPRDLLTRANARLDQSAAVAQASGPAVAGTIIAVLGVPFAFLIDAVTFLFSGAMMASVTYPPTARSHGPEAWATQISQGLRWIYRHPTLASAALTTHVWFFFNGVVGAVFVTFALTKLGFSVFSYGLVTTLAGIGALVGSLVSTRIGQRWGMGRGIAAGRNLYAPAVILLVLAPVTHHGGLWSASFLLVGLGQFVYGLALGLENPLEMGYRQAITPRLLQGRVNGTIRSINRTMVLIGAPLGGFIADRFGFRLALWLAIGGFAGVGVWFARSPMGKVGRDT